ncbi:MAG: hypothetical protein C0440_05835 [Candidatus Pelagibacter sp.]|nr:hypothetical protein [Candidatus Pelagibacter sp.]
MIDFTNKIYIKFCALLLCCATSKNLAATECNSSLFLHGIEIKETSRLTLVPEAKEMLKQSSSPSMEIHLTAYPVHPFPPVYNITFPNGQTMLILGTIHTVPLGCMLPYKLVNDIVNASDFVINEIYGQILPKQIRIIKDTKKSPDKENFNFLYMTDAHMEKMREKELEYSKRYYINDDGTEKFTGAQKCLENSVVASIAKSFDSNNCWYEKAGIIVSDDDTPTDFGPTNYWNEIYPKKLKIKGKILNVPSFNGKELHPLALEYLHKSFTGPCYTIPACGGMDNHLDEIALASGKEIYALEDQYDRYAEYPELIKEINENYKFGLVCFELAVQRLTSQTKVEKQEPQSIKFELLVKYSNLYAQELPKDPSLDLHKRNDIWIERIMTLNQTVFKHAFAYVGMGHLHDLFEKLKNHNFVISPRLSLEELEDIYTYHSGLAVKF